MNRDLLFLFLFFSCNLIVGQSKNDILDKYPFTKSSAIMIASFENLQYVTDSLSIIECREIPKLNRKVNIVGFEKLIRLNKSEYKKLQDIIYSKSIEEDIIGKGNCSETGYAVLFFDKTGNIFEYLQFCFNCKTFSSSFARDSLKNEDSQKLNQLKGFFENNGMFIRVFGSGD